MLYRPTLPSSLFCYCESSSMLTLFALVWAFFLVALFFHLLFWLGRENKAPIAWLLGVTSPSLLITLVISFATIPITPWNLSGISRYALPSERTPHDSSWLPQGLPLTPHDSLWLVTPHGYEDKWKIDRKLVDHSTLLVSHSPWLGMKSNVRLLVQSIKQ